MIQLFDKHPSVAVQRKINYYFMPYNKHFDCSKHMRFDGDDILDQIHQYYSTLQKDYLSMTAEQR